MLSGLPSASNLGAEPAVSLPVGVHARLQLVRPLQPWDKHATPVSWTQPVTETASSRPRILILDWSRGVAIVAMVLYHATLDLGPFLFDLIAINAAEDQPLVLAARLIAGSFLFIVGVSLVLAHRRGFRPRPFIRRLTILVGAALLVTIATRLVLPETYVRFGILHAIAAASVIGIVFLRAPIWLLVAAAVAIFLMPSLFSDPVFNGAGWIWLGLSTDEPVMMDYVPLLPWLGPTLVGMAFAKTALRLGWDERLASWQPKTMLSRWLIVAGRWSLPIYLVHQPILIGIIYLIALAFGRSPTLF